LPTFVIPKRDEMHLKLDDLFCLKNFAPFHIIRELFGQSLGVVVATGQSLVDNKFT